MKPDICIYHGNCADGFTAAWAVWKRWPDIEFVPGVYGEAPPDVSGKHVLIVDYSYKRPVLAAMGRDAASITILDHHKTAQEDLAPFSRPDLLPMDDLADVCQFAGVFPIQARFDVEKSGAMLAWEYCHPGAPIPALVRYVEDRDLWRFTLPGCRAVAAELFSRPYDFGTWSVAAQSLDDPEGLITRIKMGEAIERKHHKDIAELLAQTRREMVIGGFRVPVANLPYTLASDAANTLAEGAPFGACYFDRNDGKRVFSLRAVEGGEDVSKIAAAYGGGGHAKAAGFQAPPGWEGDARTP